MNDKSRHRSVTIAETLIVIGIIVLLNVVGFYAYRRLDVTENRQYALSSSTRSVLKKLDDPVTVEVFMSRDLPAQLIRIRQDVRDKLQEIQIASGGRFRVRYTDPADDEAEKERAQSLGVPEFQVQVVEREQASVKKVFFGLVMNYRDKSEAIQQLYDPTALEYEVASRLVRMRLGEKPRIGLFVGPIALNQQQPPAYQGLNQLLGGAEGFYEVVQIDPQNDRRLPENLKAVVLMGAFGLSDELKYDIDQFLMGGGNVFIAFDPMMQTGQQAPGGLGDAYPSLPTIEEQLEKYGITVNKKLVVDPGSPAQAQFRAGFMMLVQDYPLWPKIGPAGITEKVPALAKLESVVLPWCAPLSDLKREEVTFTPLFYTTDKAFLLNSPFKLEPQQNWQFLSTTSAEKGPFKVGYLVEGKIPTAYPDGPPRGEGGASQFDESKHVPKASGAGKLLVVSTASGFSDNFVQQYRENQLLLANLGDMLAIGDELADIRSAPVTSRPLKSLTSAQRNAIRWSLVVGVPLLVVLIGLAVWGARARRRRTIARKYSGSAA